MRAIYQRILDRIEASGYQVFGERIAVSPWRRLTIAVKVWVLGRAK
jgi:phytoene/squalene synthetase